MGLGREYCKQGGKHGDRLCYMTVDCAAACAPICKRQTFVLAVVCMMSLLRVQLLDLAVHGAPKR